MEEIVGSDTACFVGGFTRGSVSPVTLNYEFS